MDQYAMRVQVASNQVGAINSVITAAYCAFSASRLESVSEFEMHR
jgi:hypothetical protein